MTLIVLAILFVACVWAIALVFAVPLWVPAVCTGVVVLLIAAGYGIKAWRGARANREIQRSLAGQAAQFEKRARPDQQAEARALAVQFEKALATLKSSKLAKGKGGALYALPWYVIIGPPGAGKSTAIRQSGLQFPLQGGKGSVRGIGGTRNCDWWLTNEAVLLDTAGRYATEEDDRDEWLSFLDMLRRARPKRPLNGLIVAISVADLATGNERSIEGLSERIRERIEEVMARLEVKLPVYLVLTKCDLLPGFAETFEDLRKGERGQVFGFTLPMGRRTDEEDLGERVAEQWTRLVQVSERRSLARMADARGVDARRGVYEFPQQLESLRDNVSAFMMQTFVDNVYQDAPMVRGVYLTSGTQEGSPVDRIMGAMAEAFGLPPVTGSVAPRTDSKSYFLSDLFRQVMFMDRDLAAKNANAERRLRVVRFGGALLIAIAAGLFGMVSVRSYVANRNNIRDAQQELATAMAYANAAETEAKPIPLKVLEPIRLRLADLRSWELSGPPFGHRLGLYQGAELLPLLQTFYTTTLRAVLIQPLVDQTESGINQMVQFKGSMQQAPTVKDHAWLYDKLRAYLLLTQPKEKGEPALDADLKKWLTDKLVEAWLGQDGTKTSPGERQAMAEHVAAYLDLLSTDPKLGFARSTPTVGGARELLQRVSVNQLAIDRVVNEIDPMGMDLTLDRMVGASNLPLKANGRVRGAFTRRAWEDQVRPLFDELPPELLGDGWVLEKFGNDDRTLQARKCALRSAYFTRYAEEWHNFVNTLRMEEPHDHNRAIEVLRDLTRGQPPPIERVMRQVAFNARLQNAAPEKSDLEKTAESVGLVDKIKERVAGSQVAAKLLNKKDPCSPTDYATEQTVRRALEGFFSFGATWDEPQPGAPPQITPAQSYQEQLVYIRDALLQYQEDPKNSDALLQRLSTARTSVRGLIESQETGWHPRFDTLLWPPINGSSISSTANMAEEKGMQWCTSVLLPFQRTLHDRYPFSRNGEDAALADVADFYRPSSGIVWTFYDTVLRRDVQQVGGRFELRQSSGVGPMYTQELSRFLERSQYLSTVLFPPRADKPRVDFEVRVRPSPGIAQVLLTIDGQVVDFHNGPERWHHIVWPGEGERPGANMRVKGASINEEVKQEGEWGLLRLLDKGTISANPGERFFTVKFRLHTQNDVIIDIRPARVENPFVGAHAYLEAFRAEGVQAPRSIASGKKGCVE